MICLCVCCHGKCIEIESKLQLTTAIGHWLLANNAPCPLIFPIYRGFPFVIGQEFWVTNFRVLCTLESQSPSTSLRLIPIPTPITSLPLPFQSPLFTWEIPWPVQSLTKVTYVFLQSIVLFLWWNASQVHAMVSAVLRGFEPICLQFKEIDEKIKLVPSSKPKYKHIFKESKPKYTKHK